MGETSALSGLRPGRRAAVQGTRRWSTTPSAGGLFGGVDELEDPFGDTWAYDPRRNAWTNLRPSTAPSPREWHAMALDAETGTIVLFSGGEGRDTDLADTWIFDPRADAWSQVS